MAGCKRCARKGEKRKGKRREKQRKKEEKMGIKIVFFFFFLFFHAQVFSYAQWSFFKHIGKTVSRLSRSYPLLFAIKISIWRLVRAKYAPPPLFWQLFQISLAVLRINFNVFWHDELKFCLLIGRQEVGF